MEPNAVLGWVAAVAVLGLISFVLIAGWHH